MSPHPHNLPRSASRTLALAELMYNPDEYRDEFVFEGRDVGIGEEEEVVVTYERRKKRPTLPLKFVVAEADAVSV